MERSMRRRREIKKWKVAFLCNHNSCRSQIAEALAKRMASDVMEVYSAGVALGKDISSRAVRILKAEYNIDLLEEGHYTKLFSEIPEVDIVIYMGWKSSGCDLYWDI